MTINRDTALNLTINAIYTGVPVHPRLHAELRRVIGDTTPDEDARLRAARRAHDAAVERMRDTMRQIARLTP